MVAGVACIGFHFALADVAATIAAGTGASGDPWKVTTLELTDGCRATTFSVEDWLIHVEVPQRRTVLVQPSPSPTSATDS